jgi:hypothetical protein
MEKHMFGEINLLKGSLILERLIFAVVLGDTLVYKKISILVAIL